MFLLTINNTQAVIIAPSYKAAVATMERHNLTGIITRVYNVSGLEAVKVYSSSN